MDRPDDVNNWHEKYNENFKFFLSELYIYLISLLIKYKKYSEASLFIKKPYLLPRGLRFNNGNDLTNFTIFYGYCKSFSERNKRLNLNRISIEADLIRERATLPFLSFDDIILGDFILFLFSVLHHDTSFPWFPVTLIYSKYTMTLDFFIKAKYHKQFENLKILLDVKSKDDLAEKFSIAKEKHEFHQWRELPFRSSQSFERLMNINQLDTLE